MAINLRKTAKALAARRSGYNAARKGGTSTKSQVEWYQRECKRLSYPCDRCGKGTYRTISNYKQLRRRGYGVHCSECKREVIKENNQYRAACVKEFNDLARDVLDDLADDCVQVDVIIVNEWECTDD